jgi:DNA-binding transcriptional MerR regulator
MNEEDVSSPESIESQGRRPAEPTVGESPQSQEHEDGGEAPRVQAEGPTQESKPRTRRQRKSKDGLLTIGQVVEQLQPEFPDLSISKVRYLEDRGLVTPQRTPGGYRKYTVTEVRRLRTILSLQRDDFLPLEVIRERLSRGTASPVSTAVGQSATLEVPGSLHREEQTYVATEALELAGIGDELLHQLAEYHLVDRGPAGSMEPPPLTETDVEIARICGLLARLGVEPRNLRLLRSSVERETAMMEQLAAPALRSSNADRREEGEQLVRNLGLLLGRLIDLLLYKELRRLVN